MSLQKQLIPLSFGQGIDTKPDKKQQAIGKLRRATNVVFETLFNARKRNGYDSILLETTEGVDIDSARALTKFKTELNLFDSTKFYGFSESLQKMQQKGIVYSIFPSSTDVLSNSYNHNSLDVVYVEGLSTYVYHNTILDDVRYSVQDQVSKSLLISDDVVATGAQVVQVANIQNFIYIVYTQGVNLRYRRFNILTPSILEAPVSLAANVDAAFPLVDIIAGPDKIIVAYNSSVGGAKLRVFSIDSTGTASSIIGVTGADASYALDVVLDSNFRIIISFSDNTKIAYTIFPYNLIAALLPVTTVETIIGVRTVSTAEISDSNYMFYYEVSAAATVNHFVKQNTGNLSGVVGVASVYLRSVGLASKVFAHNGANYIPISHATVLQNTYFIADSLGNITTKWSPGIGGSHITTGVLPQTVTINDEQRLITSQIKGKLVSENGTFFGLLGVNGTVIDFDILAPYQTAMLGNNLHIAGGVLQMYDGDSVVEHGFNVYPENLTAGATATTGGFISDGNYSYVALYRWTDNAGQEHRSAPSLETTVILSGGTATQTQAIAVPTLRLSQKQNVVLELYRTENNDIVYYLVTNTAAPTFNNPTVDTVTIIDTVSDAQLISRQPLYTTGGVLENIAPQAASVVAVHTNSNRIMLMQDNTLQYSKIQQQGLPVEFSDEYLVPIDPVGGKITAGISMDDKFIIFEQDAIQYIGGQGPLNTGEQDTFTEPEIVASDVGCTEPHSVVYTPIGILFKSRKGIYHLSHGLALDYIGSPVEEFNNLTITSAKVIGELNQVRFTTSDGDCLVYNYNLGLWSNFDNHRAFSAEVIGNDYYYIRANNELFKENRTSFSDNGSPIKLLLETAWISLNVLQGFMRIYKALILGDYKSPHLLRIRCAYDFNESYVQQKVINPTDSFINDSAYGDDSPYGAGSPYGGPGNVYQPRFAFKQQKCQAIKLLIEDMQDVAGEGLSLSAITLQVGAKTGLFRVDEGNKFGVS